LTIVDTRSTLSSVSLEFSTHGDTHRLLARQWFPEPPARLFPFFADAGNLAEITPPWLGFRILTPLPVEMRVGALIDYRVSLFGVPMPWTSEITLWEPGERFVDLQRRGPYRYWHHEHRFEPQRGGTLMTDTVDYRLLFSAVLHPLFVRRNLRSIFDYRQRVLGERFAGREPDETNAGAA
jgi:ligand-binding SRPBCC domain-containing protein